MWGESYRWHFDYARLAWDTSFKFENQQKPGLLDKSQICLLDIDQIIQNRDFSAIERNIPTIKHYALEPEQAQILDPNFVKIFRISQLAVEYLLFCKKYLDNTVVLLKKELSKLKEENIELKSFNDELKEHVSELLNKIKNLERNYSKCGKCSKVFSSEEYLTAHQKKRHSNSTTSETTIGNNNLQTETDKLQSEIKLLKERLNNTERFLKPDVQTEKNEAFERDVKYQELQQKFEIWKTQVESELKLVQTQRNFEDKYEKWLESALGKLKESLSVKEAIESNEKDVDTAVDLTKREITTQTEDVKLRIETKPVLEIHSQIEGEIKAEKCDDALPIIIQEEMAKLEGNLDSKVASGLQQIENSMQKFLDKFDNVLEETAQKTTRNENVQVENENFKPQVKPRKKIQKIQLESDIDDLSLQLQQQPVTTSNNSDKRKYKSPYTLPHTGFKRNSSPRTVLKIREPFNKASVRNIKPKSAVLNLQGTEKKLKPAQDVQESDSDSTVDSQIIKLENEVVVVKKSLEKRSTTSMKTALDDRVLCQFKDEINNILNSRLQELGISPDWNSLPTRTFQRGLEIVSHQAALTEKDFKNFKKIRHKLSGEIDSLAKQRKSTLISKNKSHIGPKPKRVAAVEIKNRKMYETDSGSESTSSVPLKVQPHDSRNFSEVIKELKTRVAPPQLERGVIKSGSEESVSELSLISQNKEVVKVETQTKGVLKSYPSAGSLSKKKVLFDLSSESIERDKDKEKALISGSTTSLGSSVLDGTPRGESSVKVQKSQHDNDVEDLSDFDF